MPDSANTMFQEAVQAAQRGERARARDLLTRLLRADANNPDYWVWMSSVVDSPKEQKYCLESALRLDPNNQAAKRGLVLIGVTPPPADQAPVPPIRRKWEIATAEVPKEGLLANPALRAAGFIALILLVSCLILAGIFGPRLVRRTQIAILPTVTPGAPPTFTLTPTSYNPTPATFTPTPQITGPVPLAVLLGVTYAPTPLYVNTPHPSSEAFLIAMRAYLRGDLSTALKNMQQASQVDTKSVDIRYQIGELQRLLGSPQQAVEAYNQAIALDKNFAPAYLGRALAQQAADPEAKISKDLDAAIDKDPNFTQAYLERAKYYLDNGDQEAALKDLEKAKALNPDNAMLHVYLAQIALDQDKPETALAAAQDAYRLDQTLLPAYLVLGRSAIRNDQVELATQALYTYTTYVPQDALGWAVLGQAFYQAGVYTDALKSLNKALNLNSRLDEAYLYRGLTQIELGQGEEAVKDMIRARAVNPRSFDVILGLGRAQFAAGLLKEARDAFSEALDKAETNYEKAAAYYWRAQVIDKIGNYQSAVQDWKALLALPKSDVPTEWADTARQQLTPTASPTRTPRPSATPTPSRTPRPSATPTATQTPRASPTPSNTAAGGSPSPTVSGKASSPSLPTATR